MSKSLLITLVIIMVGLGVYQAGFNAGSESSAHTYFNQGKEGLTFEYSGTVNVMVSDNSIEIQFPDLKSSDFGSE